MDKRKQGKAYKGRRLHNFVGNKTLARSKQEAICLIEAQKSACIELDYAEGACDIVDISRLGREYRVAVMFRGQEAILVQSFNALKSGLQREKNTFRQRHLFCEFDLTSIPTEELWKVEERAACLGDLIFPFSTFINPYDTWVD